jgi:hypothetical protein
MDKNSEECQGLCAEMFGLWHNDSLRQNGTPAGYSATCDKAQRDPALRLPYIGLSIDGKYQYILLLKDDFGGYIWLVPCRTTDTAATVYAPLRWFTVFGVGLL